MKTSGVALAVFLVLTASFSQAQGPYGVDPDGCCTSFTPWQILPRVVESFEDLTDKCSRLAVVFVLKRGRGKICADPNEEWVRELILSLPF